MGGGRALLILAACTRSPARDPAAFPLTVARDDAQERRAANRAVAFSATGLAATGLAELLLAVFAGSVGLQPHLGGAGGARVTGPRG